LSAPTSSAVPASHGRLYRLAKRLSLGRLLRYLALWAHYFSRRGQSAISGRLRKGPATAFESQAAALAKADVVTTKRMAVTSWFPLDLANAGLHRAMLASVAEARADLFVAEDVLDCVCQLKAAADLSAAVDRLVASGTSPRTINTALYLLLLRRPPDPSELPMLASRHPRHALIAILSGDQYRQTGRRIVAS
jgi:hypothetical protein